MEEKIISGRKNGMAVLLLTILLYLAAIGGTIAGGLMLDAGMTAAGVVLLVVSIVYMCIGWIVLPGLKVLKPQEALVLTLFGRVSYSEASENTSTA